MHITDAIADMLTRIRNAGRAGHKTCDIPASNLKKAIADILVDEGYLESCVVKHDDKQGVLHVKLRYRGTKPVITGIRRISRPGLRVYADLNTLPRVLGGLGIAIISTSSGVKTDKQARALGVGGEVLAYVW